MTAFIAALLKQERGATALEYAFVASLISVAIYAAAITIGTNLSATFSCVATRF
jgi:pilus assembly protein Flp/PilA